MKKILATILVFLFIATGAGYSQIYKNQETETGKTTGLRNNQAVEQAVNDNYGGIFRSGLDDRPGNGEGIGQVAPLAGGLDLLFACSIVFGVVKFYKRRQKK